MRDGEREEGGGANRGTIGRDRQEGVGLGLEGGLAGPWAGLALGQMGCGEAALFSLSLIFS